MGTILAQGAQGSVKKKRKVYLSGEGVIGEIWLPLHALNRIIIVIVTKSKNDPYLIANSRITELILSITNKLNYSKRKMTGLAISNIAYWMEKIYYGKV